MNKRVRENEIPSGRRLPKKHKKAKLFNKGIAYFLVFLMLRPFSRLHLFFLKMAVLKI